MSWVVGVYVLAPPFPTKRSWRTVGLDLPVQKPRAKQITAELPITASALPAASANNRVSSANLMQGAPSPDEEESPSPMEFLLGPPRPCWGGA